MKKTAILIALMILFTINTTTSAYDLGLRKTSVKNDEVEFDYACNIHNGYEEIVGVTKDKVKFDYYDIGLHHTLVLTHPNGKVEKFKDFDMDGDVLFEEGDSYTIRWLKGATRHITTESEVKKNPNQVYREWMKRFKEFRRLANKQIETEAKQKQEKGE